MTMNRESWNLTFNAGRGNDLLLVITSSSDTHSPSWAVSWLNCRDTCNFFCQFFL